MANGAVDVCDEPTVSALDEVVAAGGDLRALAALAQGDERAELTAALKELGFKGLRTRSKIEAELKSWRP